MGFRTLAIEKQASEVWQVLAAVKTEFGKFGEVLDKVKRQLYHQGLVDRADWHENPGDGAQTTVGGESPGG